jgi:hypothetical protein
MMKVADETEQFGAGYTGSKDKVHSTIDKYSGKKPGTFDFGLKAKGNRKLREAAATQDVVLENQADARIANANQAGNYISQNAANSYDGVQPRLLALGREGGKLKTVEEANAFIKAYFDNLESDNDINKFQIGGKMNLIPEGALHARKHSIGSANEELDGNITKKGIPVISKSEGGDITQYAEIERNEVVFRKEFTDKLEELFSKYKETKDDSIAIEAGKLMCEELLNNTDDRTGLIKNTK